MKDVFVETLERLEQQNGLLFKISMRDSFIKDIQREVTQVNGSFRNSKGIGIKSLDDYMIARLEGGVYLRQKPSVTNSYVPRFKVRTDEVKNSHKQFTSSQLQKILQAEGIILHPGYGEKFVDLVAQNFLVGDSDDGPAFKRIVDSEIGSISGSETYNVNQLISHLGAAQWVDDQAGKIARLQHVAELRRVAGGMVKRDAKSAEVEKLVDELSAFERRSLRTGKLLPKFDKAEFELEFQKRFELDGDRSQAFSRTNVAMRNLDDLSQIKLEVKKTVFKNDPTPYEF